MTSPQQPQPQPESGAQPMSPAAAPTAGPMPPAAPPAAPEQPAPQQQSEQPAPAQEAGTMMLQAQSAPAPAPAQEGGTMMLQAQPLPQAQPPAGGHPEPRPLSAHGPGKDAGTMLLKAAAPPQAPQPQPAQPPQPPHPSPNYQAPHGGYVSPIPVRPTHLGHALAAEWTKIRSVRSTVWTLGVLVVLILGIGLLTATALSGHDVNPRIAFGFFGVMLGTLCIIPLGVLVISAEYGTGMIRTTMTACPSRARVLAAKAIVFFLLAFVITTLAATLVALAMSGMVGGREPTVDEWLRATVGTGLYVSLLGLLALAVGSLLRHSAGAISAMFGVVLLPMLLAVFMLGASSLQWLTKGLINYSVPNSLATLYGIPFLPDHSGPQGWTPLWILTAVAGVALGAAFLVQERRDV
ncbi:ABC transporter permease subunit [Streptomyces sp. NPDC057743]|uniref:ABC transporter permease subunit n=1 Tax=Streptomyces sp. NPDC057743 TaxID=3346236 RepID=UPI0036BFC2CF